MSKKNNVYKCQICGQMVATLHAAEPEVHCCEQPMDLLDENTADSTLEKHVPVIEKTETGIRVKVGEIPHPMTPEHFIEWIEILVDGKSYRQFLSPGDLPEAEFNVSGESIIAREYCNLHGLWKS